MLTKNIAHCETLVSSERNPISLGWMCRSLIHCCKWTVLVVAAASMLLPTGCRMQRLAVNEALLVSYRDMVWARRAYNLRYGNCERPYGEHFYNGFCSGYADICNGGDGYVPALPPAAYRDNRFQSADGAKCVNAWFEGYPAGVAAAKSEKVGNYNNVLVSKMMDSAVLAEKNAQRMLPSDVPISAEKADEKAPATGGTQIVPAPPIPDGVSSVLVPATLNPSNFATVSGGSGEYVVEERVGAVVPPIVTGSGTTRTVQRDAMQESTPSNSSRRVR